MYGRGYMRGGGAHFMSDEDLVKWGGSPNLFKKVSHQKFQNVIDMMKEQSERAELTPLELMQRRRSRCKGTWQAEHTLLYEILGI